MGLTWKKLSCTDMFWSGPGSTACQAACMTSSTWPDGATYSAVDLNSWRGRLRLSICTQGSVTKFGHEIESTHCTIYQYSSQHGAKQQGDSGNTSDRGQTQNALSPCRWQDAAGQAAPRPSEAPCNGAALPHRHPALYQRPHLLATHTPPALHCSCRHPEPLPQHRAPLQRCS